MNNVTYFKIFLHWEIEYECENSSEKYAFQSAGSTSSEIGWTPIVIGNLTTGSK